MSTSNSVIRAALELRRAVRGLSFGPPVTTVYNTLDYAWEPHRAYLHKWADSPKRVVFLGMNPGPWGMAQVGVPFGEVGYVRDWVGITGRVRKPRVEHPKRPIEGFDCERSEVSGRRLWGYFAERFGTARAFFKDHFVANYCPLTFMEEGGRNRTPDRLRAEDQPPLFAACDAHLRRVVRALEPEWVIGVGRFSAGRAESALAGRPVRVACILHPSPASPAANRDWAGTVEKQMKAAGAW